MTIPGTPRIDDPTLYEWQLNETIHTRFDYPRAWPSDRTLHIQFSIFAAINAVVATLCMTLMISMVRRQQKVLNTSVFNLYLFGIAFVDFVASFFCLLTCAMSAPMSEFFSEAMCGFQAFFLCWSFNANGGLNAMIVYQVHTLLKCKHRHHRHHHDTPEQGSAGTSSSSTSTVRRYTPPTRNRVKCHIAAVYLYAAFWAFITSFNLSFLPHQSHLYYGLACFAMEYDRPSTFFFYLVFLPFSCLVLPMLYTAYVIFDVWRRSLLPPRFLLTMGGHHRRRTLFLLRLVVLFYAVWAPFVFICFIGNHVQLSSWVFWSGAVWSHCQGAFNVLFCMTDPDIKEAMLQLVCGCCGRVHNGDHTSNTRYNDNHRNQRYRYDGEGGRNGFEVPAAGGEDSSSSLLSFLSKCGDLEVNVITPWGEDISQRTCTTKIMIDSSVAVAGESQVIDDSERPRDQQLEDVTTRSCFDEGEEDEDGNVSEEDKLLEKDATNQSIHTGEGDGSPTKENQQGAHTVKPTATSSTEEAATNNEISTTMV